MHLFSKPTTEKVIVTLRDISLIDIPPHNTPIFIKGKQLNNEIQSKSVIISNNKAFWQEPLVIECKVTKKNTEKHTEPLRLSFRFESSSGSSFTRYGIAEIDVTTAFHENIKNVQLLLSNCSYNTKFHCLIDVLRPGETRTRSNSLKNEKNTPNINSDENSLSDRSSNAIVTTTLSGGTSVNFTIKLPHEMSPVKISSEHYQFLESKVDLILSEIILNNKK